MNDLSKDLESASDQELHERTVQIARKEQQTTLELLYHLHEFERRKLYAQRGYGSLWEFVAKELRYSESQTFERISAMRLMFRVEEAKQALEEGTLSLTQAAMTERHIRAEEKERHSPLLKQEAESIIKQVEWKSKRETEKVLLSLRPLKEVVKEKIRLVTEDTSELRFSVSEETRLAMDRFWELKGRCCVAELFSTCLEFYLDRKDPKRLDARKAAKEGLRDLNYPGVLPSSNTGDSKSTLPAKLKKSTRYIPESVKREARNLAEGRCQYVDPETGRRCESRYLLQYDHIRPYAFGGGSESSNIRQLCAAHNQFMAEIVFARESAAIYASAN